MQTVNRPTAVFVVAILQFVFGGLSLVLDLCGGAMQAGGPGMFGGGGAQAQMQAEMTFEMEKAMEKRLPNHKFIGACLLVLDLALCGMMIGGGVGLVQMRPWGRKITIAYALISLVMKVVNVAMAALVSAPATREVMGAMAMQGRQPPGFGQMMDLMTSAMTWGPMCLAIYPIVVLVIMLQPHVTEAFAAAAASGAASPSSQPPDYHQHFQTGGETPPDDRFRS
jgi:hypothetical protein